MTRKSLAAGLCAVIVFETSVFSLPSPPQERHTTWSTQALSATSPWHAHPYHVALKIGLALGAATLDQHDLTGMLDTTLAVAPLFALTDLFKSKSSAINNQPQLSSADVDGLLNAVNSQLTSPFPPKARRFLELFLLRGQGVNIARLRRHADLGFFIQNSLKTKPFLTMASSPGNWQPMDGHKTVFELLILSHLAMEERWEDIYRLGGVEATTLNSLQPQEIMLLAIQLEIVAMNYPVPDIFSESSCVESILNQLHPNPPDLNDSTEPLAKRIASQMSAIVEILPTLDLDRSDEPTRIFVNLLMEKHGISNNESPAAKDFDFLTIYEDLLKYRFSDEKRSHLSKMLRQDFSNHPFPPDLSFHLWLGNIELKWALQRNFQKRFPGRFNTEQAAFMNEAYHHKPSLTSIIPLFLGNARSRMPLFFPARGHAELLIGALADEPGAEDAIDRFLCPYLEFHYQKLNSDGSSSQEWGRRQRIGDKPLEHVHLLRRFGFLFTGHLDLKGILLLLLRAYPNASDQLHPDMGRANLGDAVIEKLLARELNRQGLSILTSVPIGETARALNMLRRELVEEATQSAGLLAAATRHGVAHSLPRSSRGRASLLEDVIALAWLEMNRKPERLSENDWDTLARLYLDFVTNSGTPYSELTEAFLHQWQRHMRKGSPRSNKTAPMERLQAWRRELDSAENSSETPNQMAARYLGYIADLFSSTTGFYPMRSLLLEEVLSRLAAFTLANTDLADDIFAAFYDLDAAAEKRFTDVLWMHYRFTDEIQRLLLVTVKQMTDDENAATQWKQRVLRIDKSLLPKLLAALVKLMPKHWHPQDPSIDSLITQITGIASQDPRLANVLRRFTLRRGLRFTDRRPAPPWWNNFLERLRDAHIFAALTPPKHRRNRRLRTDAAA